eukprot:6201934-Pleurochrysis_carterae.AAC.2
MSRETRRPRGKASSGVRDRRFVRRACQLIEASTLSVAAETASLDTAAVSCCDGGLPMAAEAWRTKRQHAMV